MKNTGQNSTCPLISICCTTYNLDGYIEDALEGILSQAGDFSMEVIIHDDASTDGTQRILKKYRDAYPEMFKLILQKENQYAGNNVSLGEIYHKFIFPHVSGTYIALCDGDDYWTDPNKLRQQIQIIETEENCVACFSNARVINEMNDTEKLYKRDLVNGIIPEEKIFLGGGGLYPTSSMVFEKKALFNSLMYRHITHYISHLEFDTMLIMALCTQGEVRYINQPLSVYRRWNSGLFSSIKDNKTKLAERTEQQLKGLSKLFDYIPDRQKPYLKRKISISAKFIIRYDDDMERFKYLVHLHYKDLINLVIGR